MARTVRDARIDSRSARLSLKPKAEPYWRSLGPGTHLGYYRAAKGQAGSWIARFRPAGKKTGGYQKKRLATADDIRDPDAVEVLSFSQAQEKARAWFAEAERSAQYPDGCAIGPYAIAEVCADYLDWFTNHRSRLSL